MGEILFDRLHGEQAAAERKSPAVVHLYAREPPYVTGGDRSLKRESAKQS
ncbi:hypothetical protein [Methylosinus sp. Ce-a6]|nr:hypothetical protein [Methylosinus sp. Ce-a6]